MTVSSKTDKAIVKILKARLEPKNVGHSSSPEVRHALEAPDLRRYLTTWVYPLLDALLDGESAEFSRESILSAAARLPD